MSINPLPEDPDALLEVIREHGFTIDQFTTALFGLSDPDIGPTTTVPAIALAVRGMSFGPDGEPEEEREALIILTMLDAMAIARQLAHYMLEAPGAIRASERRN
jgi:hypothetical protein